MIILAHRGLLEGPDPVRENTPQAVARAIGLGFGIETDIRRDEDGGLYISHDRTRVSTGMEASRHAALWREALAPVALNYKESGWDEELVEFLRDHALLERVRLFDMELVEDVPGSTAGRLAGICPGIALASRASDRGEPLAEALERPGGAVWMDEFDGPWITEADVAEVRSRGRQAWMVLPDLHGAPREAALERAATFASWGADALCTDWALAVRERLAPA